VTPGKSGGGGAYPSGGTAEERLRGGGVRRRGGNSGGAGTGTGLHGHAWAGPRRNEDGPLGCTILFWIGWN
jgi:hypothetical protein